MELDMAKEAFDGIMLSDGSLRKDGSANALFQMDLSGRQHLDWLNYVKDALLTLGVMVSSMYPKVKLTQRSYNSEFYDYCSLYSRTSPMLGLQYRRWYPEKKKIVPSDLKITPVVLAHWFMGDGSSSWMHTNYVKCCFCTQCFTLLDTERLIPKMKELGLERPYLNKQGPGEVIVIGNTADVQRLMDIIEPYVLPSYKYKIKRPGRNPSRLSVGASKHGDR